VLEKKPMTAKDEQAEELVALARRRGVILAVDHTFLFTGAVRKMRELLMAGEIGEIYYIDSVRINLGLFQSDVNVIWDLAAHDVSIIDHLLGGELPREVSAVGAAHAGSPTENVAYVTMRYGENLLAHVHANWLAPAKVRRTIIGGSKRMIIYDDTQPSEKLLVYDKGVMISLTNGAEHNGTGGSDPYEHLVSYRSGDMFAPRLDDREALATEVDNLAESLRAGRKPLADGEAGLRIVRILDAAQRSLARGSEPVPLGDLRATSGSVIGGGASEADRRRVVAMPIVAHGAGSAPGPDPVAG
jgi:predicted dehydrogenase